MKTLLSTLLFLGIATTMIIVLGTIKCGAYGYAIESTTKFVPAAGCFVEHSDKNWYEKGEYRIIRDI